MAFYGLPKRNRRVMDRPPSVDRYSLRWNDLPLLTLYCVGLNSLSAYSYKSGSGGPQPEGTASRPRLSGGKAISGSSVFGLRK